ncbi:MAG: hypothetical protein ACTTH8_06445 [Treponema sp.]
MMKKILKVAFYGVLFYEILALFACNPVIGTPFYPRSANTIKPALFSIRLTVAGKEATAKLSSTPKDDLHKLELYAAAKEYMVTVPYSCEELSAEDIKVESVNSLIKRENVPVEITMNGEAVPLITGKTVPITIKIQDTAGSFGVIEKVIKVTRQDQAATQQNLILKSLAVHSIPVTDLSSTPSTVSVPYGCSAVAASDITATFTLNNEDTVIPVEIDDAPVKLPENNTTEVLIRVKENAGQYNAFEKKIAVFREQKKDDEDTALQLESLSVLGYDAKSGMVRLPDIGRAITPNDVVAAFKDFGVLDVSFEGGDIQLTDTAQLTLSIPARKGRYLAWATTIRLIKDTQIVVNPEDKNGNKKYSMSVKTSEEEIDPFKYYDENYGFPASKFDEWVVYISGFNSSTNIASYQFKDGTWSGSPEVYAGPDFGSGVKTMKSVKFYRYKSRKDRWGGTEPPLFNAEKEKRFYFYRFTASGGVDLDNSMFCVDTYSKFVFFYSEPDTVSGLGVPSGWVDYAAPSRGKHKEYPEPFYLTDPVGFVKENGQVVMYSWVQQNITKNIYAAQKNSEFTKPAEQKASEPGYSPYRYTITRKHQTVEKTENPAYTVTFPVITRQPTAIRINPNAEGEHTFSVRAVPPPEGEQLSYQWYENTIQSDQGGTLIAGATEAVYTPDKTKNQDCYVYCEVTNTNPANGKTEKVCSYAVKLLIKEGSLTVDAEQPRIITQPQNYVVPINTEKKVTLTVVALVKDKGKLSYQWYKAADKNTEGEQIAGADKEEYAFTLTKASTAAAGITYYYCEVKNTNATVDGKTAAVEITKRAAVEIEESYPVEFSAAVEQSEPGKLFGTVTAICNGKQIDSGTYIKRGSTVTFFAEAKTGYEVLAWTNMPAGAVSENKIVARLTVGTGKPDPVVVTFRKIPDSRVLTITAKEIKNSNMKYDDSYPYTYFVFNLYAKTAAEGEFQSLWHANNGEKLSLSWHSQTSKARKIYADEQLISGKSVEKTFNNPPKEYSIQLDVQLIKYHDTTTTYVGYEKYLSKFGDSRVTILYNKEKDTWSLQPVEDKNKDSVAIEFPKPFVLNRRESKDFTIKYIGSDAGKKAVGTVEVTYTLKWE